MSGAYVSGSYEIFPPQSSKGKFQKYANQIVVIVSITYNGKGAIKAAKVYLTDRVNEIMGKPAFVKLGISGSSIGIIPVDEDDGEVYTVNRKHVEGEQTGMAFINVNAFAKYLNLEEGVYSAHQEPGKVIEFNRKSKPSKV